jgi:hypothetical protein
MNTIDNARQAAARALEREDAYRGEELTLTQRGKAAAEYIRSVIRDGDKGYARELLCENSDAQTLKLLSLAAQSIDSNDDDDYHASGIYLGNMLAGYLGREVDAAADLLETRAEVSRQIADDFYWEQRREEGLV